mmetsp:Transcript_71796/g.215829  ORF Transcript_71796/g.215829 Transcript_71796/m.215829 type:complete len:284 (-) Transcript_71796:157-1008(-)
MRRKILSRSTSLMSSPNGVSISDAHSSIVKKTTAVMKPTGSTYTSSSRASAHGTARMKINTTSRTICAYGSGMTVAPRCSTSSKISDMPRTAESMAMWCGGDGILPSRNSCIVEQWIHWKTSPGRFLDGNLSFLPSLRLMLVCFLEMSLTSSGVMTAHLSSSVRSFSPCTCLCISTPASTMCRRMRMRSVMSFSSGGLGVYASSRLTASRALDCRLEMRWAAWFHLPNASLIRNASSRLTTPERGSKVSPKSLMFTSCMYGEYCSVRNAHTVDGMQTRTRHMM